MGQNSCVSFRGASALIMALAGMMISPCLGEEVVSIVEGTKDGVTVRVTCPKSFAKNRDVEIAFVVSNRSNSKYGLMVPSDLQDTRIRLVGPDGKKLVGYQEQDGWLYGFNFKRRFLEELEPGEDFEGDSVSLSKFWPMEQVGEYHCRMTKRIYRAEHPGGERLNTNNRGTPVEIEVPEFAFRIESIDPTFKSSWAPKPRSKSGASDEVDEFMSPGRWVLCISLGLTLVGILLRRLATTKAPPRNGG